MNKIRLNIPILLIVALLIFTGNTVYSQKDTLYINNFDTIRINVNEVDTSQESFYRVLNLGPVSNQQKIKLYFHLTTKDTTHTILERVYTGDGGCYFNSLSEFDESLPVLFRNNEFWGEIVYLRAGNFMIRKSLIFKLYNIDKGKWNLKLLLIGKREE